MSSLGSAQNPSYQWSTQDRVRSVDVGTVMLWGSFQGNGTSAPNVAQQRGNWFTVSRVSTGHYRVQLLLNVNASYAQQSPVQAVGPGQPQGLWAEADVQLMSETPGNLPTIAGGGTTVPTANVQIYVTKLDKINAATLNTFDIYLFTGTTGVTATATDLTASDRLLFNLTFKNTAFTP